MRPILAALLLTTMTAGAVAQEVPAPPLAASPAARPSEPASPTRSRRAHHRRVPLAERFAQANTTHDGKLTLAQARAARMSGITTNFGLIDKQQHGYVTLDDIHQFTVGRRKARQADEQAHGQAARTIRTRAEPSPAAPPSDHP